MIRAYTIEQCISVLC